MSKFNLNKEVLQKIVSRQLEGNKRKPISKLSAFYFEGVVQEELDAVLKDMSDGPLAEEEEEEEAPETGDGQQRDSAKEQGMKPDVIKVAKFMFKHKQLGVALGKIKGDKIESAQLLVLLAQELGIDASELSTMQVKMKAAMTKAEK